VAGSDSTVLVQGETGTGKELMARAVHDLSRRRNKPFVAINCGALPDTLLESELFGYKAGAFTDASKDKPGHFALAEGGTILLDEIGDLSAAFQARLLRVIQEKTYQPLGGTVPVEADVRIIAATNKDLSELVKTGQFRQDLFYRINVVLLEIPPLRKRKEDIPMLVKYFIDKLNLLRGTAVEGISQEAVSLLMFHNYPGNIRELENIVEHAFVLCPEGRIEVRCLPDYLSSAVSSRPAETNMTIALQTAETRVILDALKRNRYNRLATSRDLGIHKSTLYRKISRLGIRLPENDGRYRTTFKEKSHKRDYRSI
jgi:transcriptional regulator with PAS, ATPase and Fis domain